MRERVKWIKSWETEPKASARSNQVQWRVFFIFPSMEKKGVQDSAVLNAAIDAREESFLESRINKFVCQKERLEA